MQTISSLNLECLKAVETLNDDFWEAIGSLEGEGGTGDKNLKYIPHELTTPFEYVSYGGHPSITFLGFVVFAEDHRDHECDEEGSEDFDLPYISALDQCKKGMLRIIANLHHVYPLLNQSWGK